MSANPGRPSLPIEPIVLVHGGSEAGAGVPGAQRAPGGKPPFEPQEMIEWWDPGVLFKAALESISGGTFGKFADKREIEAGLPSHYWDATRLPASHGGGFWFDYVADTGDGFGPTYSVASRLGQPRLEVGEETLPRGQILMLGGDQVYPSASWADYRNRFVGPYAGALPGAEGAPHPFMFALPGNHDWYDGLTSFMRLFCQGAWIGGWKTEQERSYFAVKLPHDVWVLAIDTQLSTYIDGPQLRYFRAIGPHLRGCRVILMTAKPYWIEVEDPTDPPDGWRMLAFLEERVIKANGARLVLSLTGDLHHYCHFRQSPSSDPGAPLQHKITAGGGGAALSGTWGVAAELPLPDHDSLKGDPSKPGRVSEYTRVATWPDEDDSKAIVKRAMLRPPFLLRTPRFGLVTALLYAIAGLLLGIDGDLIDWWIAPIVALFALALYRLAQSRSPIKRKAGALVHAALHVGVALAGALAWTEGVDSGQPEGAVAGAAVAGFLIGPFVLVAYMLAFHLGKNGGSLHRTELFGMLSTREGSGYKHFLRLRIEPDRIAVYPIGFEKTVPTAKWTESDGAQWFTTDDPPPPVLLSGADPIEIGTSSA